MELLLYVYDESGKYWTTQHSTFKIHYYCKTNLNYKTAVALVLWSFCSFYKATPYHDKELKQAMVNRCFVNVRRFPYLIQR